MKLLELYSRACGLKIGKQFLLEAFYPVPFEKYITIQSGSGMAAKNYPYYNEVIKLIKNALSEIGVEIVQLGGKDDQPIVGVNHFQGKTDLHQSNYILKRSMLHIGNDSWIAHRAGELKIPLVSLYSSTSIENHSPYKFNKDKTIFIESHRFGKNPSFAAQELFPTISLISPEQIANSILKLLNIPQVSHKTIFFGTNYNESIIELVPNSILAPQVQVAGNILIRMDYEFNEENLAKNLQIRKCAIVTNKELNLNILSQLKGNISLIKVEIDNISIEWVKSLKRIGIPAIYFSFEKDEKKIKEMRLNFFDYCFFDVFSFPKKENFINGSESYLNNKFDNSLKLDELKYKSNKLILSNGKIFISYFDYKNNKSVENLENNISNVSDTDEFWKEQNYFYIYKS